MDGKKIYTIEINGIKQSIDAVESLNKQLKELESRIKTLENSNVNVKSSGSSSKGNVSSLSEEDALQKEINKLKKEGIQLDAKIEASQNEIYKRVDATKQLYKETIADQKAIAAQERLVANAYSNTMQGMKSKLGDLKAVINTTDMGDSDKIKQMTQEANQLTNKLKEMEQAYGQFGRNVGNYQDAANGFKKLEIEVNGVTRSFDNAKQALMALKKERDTLGVTMGRGTKEFKELDEIVKTLQSDIKDMAKSSAAMDNLLDTMQSITAIASMGQGLNALFGFDDNKIQKSIQKLVAFQNVLKGIETINLQMQTREGIGSIFAKGSDAIDKMVNSIFGVEKASKAATVAAKTLGTALKGIGIGLVIAAVMELINLFEEWSDKQKKAAEEAEEAAEKVKKAIDEQRQAYVNASVAYMNTASRLSYLRTEYKQTNDELRKTNIIKEASAEFKKLGINVKSVNDAQRIFVESGGKVIQLLKLQGDAAAIAALRMEAFKKSFQMLLENGYDANAASILAGNNKTVLELDKRLGAINDQIGTIKGELKIGVDDIGKGVSKAIENNYKTIQNLELRLMKEGLNKRLRQLDIEEQETLKKLKENATKNAAEIKKIQDLYNEIRQKEINDYLNGIEKAVKDAADNIEKTQFDINIKEIEGKLTELQNKFDWNSISSKPKSNTLITSTDNKKLIGNLDKEKFATAKAYSEYFDEGKETKNFDKYYDFLARYIDSKNKVIKDKIYELYYLKTDGSAEDKERAFYKGVAQLFEKEYRDELEHITLYTKDIEETLASSFDKRMTNQRDYDEKVRQELIKSIKEQSELNKKKYEEEDRAAQEAENARFKSVQMPLQQMKDEAEETLKTFVVVTEEDKKTYEKLQAELADINAKMEENQRQHEEYILQMNTDYDNKLYKNKTETFNNISDLNEQYFNEQIANFRDMQSKINEEMDKQPVYNGLGIVNLAATKKEMKEIEKAFEETFSNIKREKLKLMVVFSSGLLSPEAMNKTIQQLNEMEAMFKALFAAFQNDMKDVVPKFVQSLNQYLQPAANMMKDIMSAVWSAQDAAYERMIEELEREIDKYEDLLRKQEDITREHSDKVNDIEDELATARGDRRQHLIDQLNAEIAAQRESLAQQKKYEKEQKKLKDKAAKEELEQKKRQQQRDIVTATINAAMAVSMAAANHWPTPAIPLMAMAAAAGAAQIAAIASQKYAKGGLLEGKSHAEGGIPVGNTGIEVEGHEYIIRKRSTAQNIDLLDYINKSERKLDLSDFIDFYSKGKVKNSLVSPRGKFADGGQIPTLTSDYTFNDRLLDAFEDYSNRQVVVSVVDINNRQNAVKSVEVLAGLDT